MGGDIAPGAPWHVLPAAWHGEKATAGDGAQGEEREALLLTPDRAIGSVGIGVLETDRRRGFLAHVAIAANDNLILVNVMKMRRNLCAGEHAVHQKSLRLFVDNTGAADIVGAPAGSLWMDQRNFCGFGASYSLHGLILLAATDPDLPNGVHSRMMIVPWNYPLTNWKTTE